MFNYVAFKMLEAAGYSITPADGIPGLWNIEGLARDVTLGQMRDLAERHGQPWAPPIVLSGPSIRNIS